MRQSIWMGNGNNRGISPKPLVKRLCLNERECGQIFKCKKKKKMFACLNMSNLIFEALHKQNELMYVNCGGGSRENEYQRENLVRRFTTLLKCFHCCPSRSSSSFKLSLSAREGWQGSWKGRGLGNRFIPLVIRSK